MKDLEDEDLMKPKCDLSPCHDRHGCVTNDEIRMWIQPPSPLLEHEVCFRKFSKIINDLKT